MRRGRYAVMLYLLVLLSSCSREHSVPWSQLVNGTFLGVACHGGSGVIDEPFAEQCEKVGLAVWMHRPATQLRVWVAGQRVTMHGGFYGDVLPPGQYTYFVGYLQPAGFAKGKLRVGHDTTLRMTAYLPNGKRVSSSTKTQSCCGGWG